MFCSSCGTQLEDSAMFCSSCGKKVGNSTNTEISVTQNEENTLATKDDSALPAGQRANVVSNESMKNLGINKTIFQARVDSVDDPEVNDRLFTLYRKLVEPVKAIEDHMVNIENRSKIFEERVYMTFPGKVGCVIVYFILLFLIDNYIGLFLSYSTVMALESSPWGYAILFLGPIPVAYLILLLIHFLISQIFKRNLHLKQEKARQENEVEYQEVSNIINSIKQYITFVPPAYRTSAALDNFSRSYLNSRASNLYEAIKVYDTDKKHDETIGTLQQGFTMMAEMNQRILGELQSIRYEQVTMQAQLSAINASIWAANIAF